MKPLPSRNIRSIAINGEQIHFIASNKRIAERVESLSGGESHILNKILDLSHRGRMFWDVGACFGIHSFVAQSRFEDVVAFEPMPANRGALIDNMGVNSFDGLYVEPCALAKDSGVKRFAIRQSGAAGYGRHSLDVGNYDSIRTIDVCVEPGDSYLDKHGHPSLVKIDVEGAEGLVIEGMEETLSDGRCRDVLVETHEPNPVQPSYKDFGYELDDIYSMLENYGFEVEEMEKRYHLHGHKE